MASLTAITALGSIEARDDLIGGVRITEIADTCLASLAMRRGKAARFRKAAQTALYFPFKTAILALLRPLIASLLLDLRL